jgi:hypothetical protein
MSAMTAAFPGSGPQALRAYGSPGDFSSRIRLFSFLEFWFNIRQRPKTPAASTTLLLNDRGVTS